MPKPKPAKLPKFNYSMQRRCMSRCQSDDDGHCTWKFCPQNRDGEPHKTGRHCPLDTGDNRLEAE